MKNPIVKLTRQGKIMLNCANQLLDQRKNQVRFYNMWPGETHDEMYWYRYLKAKEMLNTDKTIAFFSVFGPRKLMDYVHTDVKVFVSAENLKARHYSAFSDHCLGNPDVDLAMGFEVFDDSRYIRFPNWMDYMFSPEYTKKDILDKCNALRYPVVEGKKKFCCMVASNGAGKLRDEMYCALSSISHVDSAGRYLHNDDSLQEIFNDVKVDYMKQYMFNICPENSSAYGYTTEKLFEAIAAGCIPVYWGAKSVDWDIVNEEAVVFWDRKDNGSAAVRKIKELYDNPSMLNDFLHQPRLKPYAEEYIIDTFESIENKFKKLLHS